jgi:GDP-mannose pyrophosphatase NudK
MPDVKSEKIVFDQKLVIGEGLISINGKEHKRLKVKREDASAVLIFNTENNTIVLTQQFRYPIHDKVKGPIVEILAGKVDDGENPLETAIREGEEETGYRIRPGNIKLILSCFSTPGYSSEKFHIYYATVSNEDKTSKGGGLEAENEHITVLEMPLDEFVQNIEHSRFEDSKTCIAGLYFCHSIYQKQED